MRITTGTRVMLVVLVLSLLLASCSDLPKRLPTWKIPKVRGPVDVFEDLIRQIEGIGQGISHMFRGFGGRR